MFISRSGLFIQLFRWLSHPLPNFDRIETQGPAKSITREKPFRSGLVNELPAEIEQFTQAMHIQECRTRVFLLLAWLHVG
jgi:hypothetical protein